MHGTQWHVPEKSDDLENLIFQQCEEKGIEDWGDNTDGDTIGEVSKCETRVPSNTEMQVPGSANTFTSTTELPVRSGLKR